MPELSALTGEEPNGEVRRRLVGTTLRRSDQHVGCVCSCGSAFGDLTALDDHLVESSENGSHDEMALDLGTLVRFGIRRIRTERGLSMHAMADLLGVHTSAVCRIESGKRNAVGMTRTPRTVALLLGVEVRELLRICGHCGYLPPVGCQCLRCGMTGQA